MKEEALKLAVWLENMSKLGWADNFGQELDEISAMIRRLVEELDMLGEESSAQQELIKEYNKLLVKYWGGDKPLNDKEMMEVIEKIGCTYNPSETEISYDYEVRLARAIEERHGIK